MRKNEKNVILCLLEVARRGAKFGMFSDYKSTENFSLSQQIEWSEILQCQLYSTKQFSCGAHLHCIYIVSLGMLAPMLVQMERQIDREIAADNKANNQTFGTQTDEETQKTSTGTSCEEDFESDSEEDEDDGQLLMYGPQPQIITNDLKSLDEMVSKVSNITYVSTSVVNDELNSTK